MKEQPIHESNGGGHAFLMNILQKVDSALERLDSRQSTMDARVHNIEQTLSANTASLQEHMRRTHTLEILVGEVRKENELRSKEIATSLKAHEERDEKRLVDLEQDRLRITVVAKSMVKVFAVIISTGLAILGAYIAGKGKLW